MGPVGELGSGGFSQQCGWLRDSGENSKTLKSWETGMQSRARENETKSSLPKTFTVKETPPTVWRIHGNIIIFVPKT